MTTTISPPLNCSSTRRSLPRPFCSIWLQSVLFIVLVAYPTTATHNSPDHRHGIANLERSPLSRSTDGLDIDVPTDLAPRSSFNMPRPFDTNLSNNFTTDSCPSFFTSFLSNTTITNCHAISLLLQDSTSFFHTLSSAPATSRTLDAACSAPFSQCASTMSSLATSLREKSHCGNDYDLSNPLVRDAYTDFVAYEPVYKATCLTNPDTKDYCFVDAVFSNRSADYNLYFLPLGTSLSRSANITCSKCLQATMDLFRTWAVEDGQPLAESYLPSARNVNRLCGRGFADVNVTVGAAEQSSDGLRLRLDLGVVLGVMSALIWGYG